MGSKPEEFISLLPVTALTFIAMSLILLVLICLMFMQLREFWSIKIKKHELSIVKSYKMNADQRIYSDKITLKHALITYIMKTTFH